MSVLLEQFVAHQSCAGKRSGGAIWPADTLLTDGRGVIQMTQSWVSLRELQRTHIIYVTL